MDKVKLPVEGLTHIAVASAAQGRGDAGEELGDFRFAMGRRQQRYRAGPGHEILNA